jgi:PAS domain S-box-containing protein
VGSPRPFARVERSAKHAQLAQGASTSRRSDRSVPTVRLLLLEPHGSTYAQRIESAANEAGLSVAYLDSVESVPANAAVIGVGPSVLDPLQVARQLRAMAIQPLLVFFAASIAARSALQAELVRDPFLYPRFELIELPDNTRQLASRMGKVVAQVKRQLHTAAASRRGRSRSRALGAPARALVNGEHFLAHVLAHTHDAIVSTDAAGRILTWNDAARDLFGFQPEAVIGRRLGVLDGSGNQLDEIARHVVASGEPQQARVSCSTSKGDTVHVAANVTPVRDRQGSVLGVSVIARDDSEYQRVQDALREANRQKDEFLAIMSHELRTPLTSILGYTDMLLRGLSGPLGPLTNKYLGNVRSAGDRLLELVNGLLDYTRLEAGADRLELQRVDVSRLVTQAVQHCEAAAQSKDINLKVSIGRGFAAHVQADEERLTHVMRNFLNNALKFTPDGGKVRVQVARDPHKLDAVRVSVADSGIGMREEQIGRVWERFYQGDSSLTKPYGGMGLGLSIARHLVALHGGTVGAHSRGPGRGSTFWFTLPQATGTH